VEYAMSRHLSPALVAQYETQMIPKAVLQQKLREWSLMLEAPDGPKENRYEPMLSYSALSLAGQSES